MKKAAYLGPLFLLCVLLQELLFRMNIAIRKGNLALC